MTTALSRRDQSTSAIAARRVEASGAGETQRAMVLRAVIENPGKSMRALAEIINRSFNFGMDLVIEEHRVASRLAELKTDGKVWNGDKEYCDVAGQVCKTWYPSAAIEKPAPLPAPENYFGKTAAQGRLL